LDEVDEVESAYIQASAEGHGSEFAGRELGAAAVLLATTLFVPEWAEFVPEWAEAGAGELWVGLREAAVVAPVAKAVQITLRGVEYIIPGWRMEELTYTKVTAEVREALRAEFPSVRRAFVKDLAENHVAELRDPTPR